MSRLDLHLDDDLSGRLYSAARASGESQSELARRAIARVVREPGPYTFEGTSHSLVRDLWATQTDNDRDGTARERLHKFVQWSDDAALQFEQVNTTTAADVLPPGYRLAAELVPTSDRPLVAAAERGSIDDASLFTVPTIREGFTAVDDSRAEGVNPPIGDMEPEIGRGVTQPRLLVGRFELTREIADAASPAGDLVVMEVAAESWRREAEARVYAELNDAQSGTITGGFSGDGAMVETSSAAALTDDLKAGLGRYAATRLRRPRNVIVGAAQVENIDAWDGTSVASWLRVNVDATTTDFATGAGDAQVVVLGSGDLWSWQSPILRFRFDQGKGPALVDAGVHAYHAVKLVRPRGLLSVRVA